MSKLLVSLSVSKKYNWFDFKQITVIEEKDLELLTKINPFFTFCELTGNHDYLEFYFLDLDTKIISTDEKEIEYLEKLGVTDAGIKDFDLIDEITSKYPEWRENIFDEEYEENYAGFKSIYEYNAKRHY